MRLIASVIGGNDTASVNDAGKPSTNGEDNGQNELAGASVLPKDPDWWKEVCTEQSTALVAAPSGAISVVTGHLVCLFRNFYRIEFVYRIQRFGSESIEINANNNVKV